MIIERCLVLSTSDLKQPKSVVSRVLISRLEAFHEDISQNISNNKISLMIRLHPFYKKGWLHLLYEIRYSVLGKRMMSYDHGKIFCTAYEKHYMIMTYILLSMSFL